MIKQITKSNKSERNGLEGNDKTKSSIFQTILIDLNEINGIANQLNKG
jgi:hypothetical protein